MKFLKFVSVFMALLLVMIPVSFAYSLTYDANGNLISGDGFHRTYNSLNQLSQIRIDNATGTVIEELYYHPVEERVLYKKVYNNDSTWKETVYYVGEDFVKVVNASGEYDFQHVIVDGQQIAQINPDGEILYIHADHLGSSSIVTNGSGDVIEETHYDPYGQILQGGEETRFDYEGKEFDSVIQSVDFHFRQYDPELGIFTQPDTLIPNVYDPQTLNRYMFERGNPYKYTDPDGHCGGLCIAGALIIGSAILGAVVETSIQLVYAGRIYDPSAIVNSAGLAALSTSIVLSSAITYGATSLVTGGATVVLGSVELISLEESINNAKKYKLDREDDEDSQEPTKDLEKVKKDEFLDNNENYQDKVINNIDTSGGRGSEVCIAGYCTSASSGDSLKRYLEYKGVI